MTRGLHTRSREGCLACRKYHVKCDLERPICQRCARLGRTCEWDSLKPALTSTILKTSDELRHYRYYRDKMSHRLDGAFSQAFWRRLLLQVSYTDIALQHLLVALSALDQVHTRDTTDPENSLELRTTFEFCLQQYNLGMNCLQSRVAEADHAVLLAAHLIIAFLEKWLNEHPNAERGSLAISKVLELGLSSEANHPDSTMKILEHLVRREIAEFACLHTMKVPPLRCATVDTASLLGSFNNVGEASERFHDIYSHMMAIYQDLYQSTPDVQLFIQSVQSLLQQWHRPFSVLRIQVLQSNQPTDIRDVLLMDLRYNIVDFGCVTLLFPRHKHPQRSAEILEDLLIICGKIWEVETHLCGFENNTAIRNFTPDTGIVLCLHVVALLSTNHEIRRQAVRLLYRLKKVEGSFASDALAVVSEHVLQIEESISNSTSPSTDVPFGNQIELISTTYQVDDRHSTEYDQSFERRLASPPSSHTDTNGPTAQIEFQWIRLADQHRQIHKTLLPLIAHESRSVIKSRSKHWWPVPASCPLLEIELSSENRKRSGPHFGSNSFKDIYDFSFQSICSLTVLRTSSREA